MIEMSYVIATNLNVIRPRTRKAEERIHFHY